MVNIHGSPDLLRISMFLPWGVSKIQTADIRVSYLIPSDTALSFTRHDWVYSPRCLVPWFSCRTASTSGYATCTESFSGSCCRLSWKTFTCPVKVYLLHWHFTIRGQNLTCTCTHRSHSYVNTLSTVDICQCTVGYLCLICLIVQ